jgi:hypothetical protein
VARTGRTDMASAPHLGCASRVRERPQRTSSFGRPARPDTPEQSSDTPRSRLLLVIPGRVAHIALIYAHPIRNLGDGPEG